VEINDATASSIQNLRDIINDRIKNAEAFDSAAQNIIEAIYEEYQESMVLARLYATIPLEKLPVTNQNFVNALVATKQASDLLKMQTPVLSLLGTYGVETEWNDRRNSRTHTGYPLISEDFVEGIPMMASLLKELGMSLDWFAPPKDDIASKSVSRIVGEFYVADAKTALDHKDRYIISAQDFVANHNVKTVFGLGSVNVISRTFIVTIFFTRHEITRQKVAQFMPLMSGINTAVSKLILQNKLFSTEPTTA
jgi:hypothetical protein